jgi:hypothetical protein
MSPENIGMLMEKMKSSGGGCAGCMGGACSGCPFARSSEQKIETLSVSSNFPISPNPSFSINRLVEMQQVAEITCVNCGGHYESHSKFDHCPYCGNKTKN